MPILSKRAPRAPALYSPFANVWPEMTDLQNRLARFFEPVTPELFTPVLPVTPFVDLVEKENEFVLTAELPGMDKKDIDLVLENNVLTIKGEKAEEKKEEEKERKYLFYERTYGAFARSFNLPVNVDPNAIVADFDRGVLTIHLPKTAEAKGHRIPIAEG